MFRVRRANAGDVGSAVSAGVTASSATHFVGGDTGAIVTELATERVASVAATEADAVAAVLAFDRVTGVRRSLRRWRIGRGSVSQ